MGLRGVRSHFALLPLVRARSVGRCGAAVVPSCVPSPGNRGLNPDGASSDPRRGVQLVSSAACSGELPLPAPGLFRPGISARVLSMGTGVPQASLPPSVSSGPLTPRGHSPCSGPGMVLACGKDEAARLGCSQSCFDLRVCLWGLQILSGKKQLFILMQSLFLAAGTVCFVFALRQGGKGERGGSRFIPVVYSGG